MSAKEKSTNTQPPPRRRKKGSANPEQTVGKKSAKAPSKAPAKAAAAPSKTASGGGTSGDTLLRVLTPDEILQRMSALEPYKPAKEYMDNVRYMQGIETAEFTSALLYKYHRGQVVYAMFEGADRGAYGERTVEQFAEDCGIPRREMHYCLGFYRQMQEHPGDLQKILEEQVGWSKARLLAAIKEEKAYQKVKTAVLDKDTSVRETEALRKEVTHVEEGGKGQKKKKHDPAEAAMQDPEGSAPPDLEQKYKNVSAELQNSLAAMSRLRDAVVALDSALYDEKTEVTAASYIIGLMRTASLPDKAEKVVNGLVDINGWLAAVLAAASVSEDDLEPGGTADERKAKMKELVESKDAVIADFAERLQAAAKASSKKGKGKK